MSLKKLPTQIYETDAVFYMKYLRKLQYLNRKKTDFLHTWWMKIALIIVVGLPIFIGCGLYLKASTLLHDKGLFTLLFTSDWRPVAGSFGFMPFIVSSIVITILALLIAAPVCLFAAIYLTQYANHRILKIMHPIIDILAGLPSVIFGVWGIVVVVPMVSNYIAPAFGYQTSGYCILSGAIVLSIMIIPFILNILIDVFQAIPDELTEVTLSMGTTRWQCIRDVLLRKALPGIISAIALGLARAFGETIAVLMVVGNRAVTPGSVFDAGYPLPALIANNYGEMLSIPSYDSALMLAALILFVVVLSFNLFSRLLIIRFEKRV